MQTEFTNSRDSIAGCRKDTTDWASLTTAQRIRSIELEGYVVIPDLLSPQQISDIGEELARLPTKHVDYSENQRGFQKIEETDSPHAIAVVGLPAIVQFLTELFGDDLICTSCAFTATMPGFPGIAIHTDCQPYGSKIFGLQSSSPCLVRALYYLDDLTPERSPLKVIPRSHLSLHADANPYNRFLRHDEEMMVTCKAGSAAIINQRIFHGNFPNYSDGHRRMLAVAYRPAWAGPIVDVPERAADVVARLPPHIRRYFGSLNTKNIDFDVPNRKENMATSGPGVNASRWGE